MARSLTGVLLKDKWRIDGLLGEGGVAAVYAATHRNGKRVAVKILHPHLASVPEVRGRFLREGYVANRIEHPAAVQVLDDDVTQDGLVFLVMELLTGESADRRQQREGRLAPATVLALTDELLDVLDAAHSKGVLHRDLKPENVFITKDGHIKLLDFGIARLHEQQAASSATQTGAAMGTPSYMPPEQARGRWEEVDARSDLWAVGATMFTLLVGRCVHEGETINETLLQAMTQHAPSLATVWPKAPPAIAAVVDRALAFDRDARWPDAATMRRAVREAITAGGPVSEAQPMLAGEKVTRSQPTPVEAGPRGTLLVGTMTPAATVPELSRRRWLGSTGPAAAVAGAAFLVIVGAVVVLAGRSGAPSPEPVVSASAPAPSATPSSVLVPSPQPAQADSVQLEPVPSATTIAVETLPPVAAPRVPPAPPSPRPTASTASIASWAPAAPPRPASPPTSDPLNRRK